MWVDLVKKGNTVDPLLNGNPLGNGLWLLKRGWPLNRGRKHRKAIFGTLIVGRLIEVVV